MGLQSYTAGARDVASHRPPPIKAYTCGPQAPPPGACAYQPSATPQGEDKMARRNALLAVIGVALAGCTALGTQSDLSAPCNANVCFAKVTVVDDCRISVDPTKITIAR